jgi:hypothetical protein
MPDLRRAPVFRSGALQFDHAKRNHETENAMQQARRRADVATGSKPRDRHQPWQGYPVEVRNGLPAPRFRVVTDTDKCGCVRRFRPSLMDWVLDVNCGGHYA